VAPVEKLGWCRGTQTPQRRVSLSNPHFFLHRVVLAEGKGKKVWKNSEDREGGVVKSGGGVVSARNSFSTSQGVRGRGGKERGSVYRSGKKKGCWVVGKVGRNGKSTFSYSSCIIGGGKRKGGRRGK